MKTIFVVLVALALTGFIGWRVAGNIRAAGAAASRPNGSKGAVAVKTAPVRQETIREVRELTGNVLPKEQFLVAPKVAGRLEKLLVNVGDRVKNGDVLALQDNQEYMQQVEQARAGLEVARATLVEAGSAAVLAERDYVRVKELSKGKMVSEAEMDQFQAKYHVAQAKQKVAEALVKQQEAALKADEVRLTYTRIAAAWESNGGDRVVGERFVDQGAMLRANDPVVSILDINTVVVALSVIEREYPLVRLGQAAVVRTDAFPGRTFAGTVVRKAPLLKEASRQARVEIEIPNPEWLLTPGLFARAELEFAVHEQATVVPVTALVRRDNRNGVFLVDVAEMKARFVPVSLGITEGESVEVTSPPLTGTVVTLGHHLLEDGAAILLPAAREPAPAGRPGGERQ